MEFTVIRVIVNIFRSVLPVSDSQKHIGWCHLPFSPVDMQ